MDWKGIWKFLVTNIYDLQFNWTSTTNYKFYDEKRHYQWYISVLLTIYNYQKHQTFKWMKNCNNVQILKNKISLVLLDYMKSWSEKWTKARRLNKFGNNLKKIENFKVTKNDIIIHK